MYNEVNQMKKIAILGSTGSIGTQTLEVVRAHPQLFQVVALAAGSNGELAIEQAHEFKPQLLSVKTKEIADQIRLHLPDGVTLYYGQDGMLEVATCERADVLVTAVVGSVGLRPTLAAIEQGKTIALANKETLVTAGQIVMDIAKQYGVSIIPVDSEHSAIYQCLQGENKREVESIILTASGGSFRHKNRSELVNVTLDEALKHPNWSMGAKITIDSATMMNKGLEVIEAHWLFNTPYKQIDVLLHDESIIHSMVQFCDSAVMAQLGTPDMKVPIQYALSYPERLPMSGERLQLAQIGQLHFRPMDYDRYRCLALAFEAGRAGGTLPTVLNAANEIAVERFIKGDITFLGIESIIEETLNKHVCNAQPTLEQIEEADAWARRTAETIERR